jgi:hypothetical protein
MPPQMSRRLAFGAVVIVSLGLSTLSGVQLAAAAVTPSSPTHTVAAALPPPGTLTSLPTITPNCAPLIGVRTGTGYATCVASVSPQSPVPVNPAAVPAAPKSQVAITSPYPNPQLECASLQTNEWWYEREWFCIIDQGVVISTINTSNGQTIGQATYTVTHAGGLDPQGSAWTNFTALYLSAEWGDYASIVGDSNACSPCSGIQSGNPFGGTRTATPGVAVTGSDNLSDIPLPGAIAMASQWSGTTPSSARGASRLLP